ncbi:MAG: hypothetical protein J6M47_09925 [Clostridia bacterium]|nr:hypothetical protein [Clostridia bacterium]
MFVTTKAAAQATGLSEFELRSGFKQGRYPALEVGRGDRRRCLRWDLDVLQQALRQQMCAERCGTEGCN